MDYLGKVKHFFSFQSEVWRVELYYMVLHHDFSVIASQRARWRGNPFSFGSMWLILVCGERRIATVAALPRNDRWETIPSVVLRAANLKYQ